MSFIFIILGIFFIACGIFGLANHSGKEKDQRARREAESVQTRAYTERTSNENVDITSTEKFAQSDADANRATAINSEEDASKQKGNNFEAYVVDAFKEDADFRILEWHQGATTPNGNYAEDELKPDLHVCLEKPNGRDITFWVECKYRSNLGAGFFIEKYQFDRYKKHQRDTRRKVIIALGTGGDSTHPHQLYLVPIDSLSANIRFGERDLAAFKVSTNAGQLRQYVESYFSEIFTNAKQKKHGYHQNK